VRAWTRVIWLRDKWRAVENKVMDENSFIVATDALNNIKPQL
jgi:hypothetical protein